MPITERILNRIKDNTNGSINLSSLNIDDDDMPILIQELRKKKNLVSLSVQKNLLSDKSATLIATLPLQVLNIRRNDVCDEGLSELLKNPKLLRLDIGMNGITDSCLNDFLQNENLTHVNLQENEHVSENTLKKIKDHLEINIINKQQNEENLFEKSKCEEIKEFSTTSNVSSKNMFSERNQDEIKEKLLPDSGSSSADIIRLKNQ